MSNRFLKSDSEIIHSAVRKGTNYINVFEINEVYDVVEKDGDDGEKWVVIVVMRETGHRQDGRFRIEHARAKDIIQQIEERIHCEMDYARLGKASLVPETPEKPEKKDTE